MFEYKFKMGAKVKVKRYGHWNNGVIMDRRGGFYRVAVGGHLAGHKDASPAIESFKERDIKMVS